MRSLVDDRRRHAEHEVGQHRAGHRPGQLGHRVPADLAPGEPVPGTPSQEPVRQGDDRVEVRPRHRTEQQDQHCQPEDGGRAVLQQLQADIVRRQLLGRDPRADDDRDQQGAAEELGQQAPAEWRPGGRRHGAILTGRR